MKNAKAIAFYRLFNNFVIGKGNKPGLSLPQEKGMYFTIDEERDKRQAAKQPKGFFWRKVVL